MRNERERLEQRRRFLSSSKQSQPEPDTNQENAYFSPPNEVSRPDDIERNQNKKNEAYDGAIEKLKSLSKKYISNQIAIQVSSISLYNYRCCNE